MCGSWFLLCKKGAQMKSGQLEEGSRASFTSSTSYRTRGEGSWHLVFVVLEDLQLSSQIRDPVSVVFPVCILGTRA